MPLKLIITSEKFIPVIWSGGTTTELFIFPPTAVYSQRNFQFRLSTASVQAEMSEFTMLEGISRKLMVLSGKTTLSHEGHYTKHLNKFEVDEFDGDWKTTSAGRCTDFNLMTRGKTKGDLKALVINENQSVDYELSKDDDWLFIYVFSGAVSVDLKNEKSMLLKGDLLVMNNLSIMNLRITGIENSELVLSGIKL